MYVCFIWKFTYLNDLFKYLFYINTFACFIWPFIYLNVCLSIFFRNLFKYLFYNFF